MPCGRCGNYERDKMEYLGLDRDDPTLAVYRCLVCGEELDAPAEPDYWSRSREESE